MSDTVTERQFRSLIQSFGGKLVYVHGVAVDEPPEPARDEHRLGV